MDSVLISQKGGEKENNHDGDGASLKKQDLSTRQPRKERKAEGRGGNKGVERMVPRAWDIVQREKGNEKTLERNITNIFT